MIGFLDGQGFLGANASMGADLSLVLTAVSVVLLTIGWRLAVGKRYEAHRWTQTAATCLIAVVLLAWMIRSFVRFVAPEIPARLGERAYGLSTLHAVIGVAAFAFGVFVVLRGNELVPQGLRFRNYKPFMRAAYILYILGAMTGVSVYYVLYVG